MEDGAAHDEDRGRKPASRSKRNSLTERSEVKNRVPPFDGPRSSRRRTASAGRFVPETDLRVVWSATTQG
jgi:hypothetical protein